MPGAAAPPAGGLNSFQCCGRKQRSESGNLNAVIKRQVLKLRENLFEDVLAGITGSHFFWQLNKVVR